MTLSRQANERQNDIFSNQTNLTAASATGRLRHELSAGLEISSESQFAPTLGGVGTRAPIDLNRPDVFSPVVGMNIVPTGALSEGSTDTVGVLSSSTPFDLGAARARQRRDSRRELRHDVARGGRPTGVVTDIEGDGTLVSGKAGLVFRLNDAGQPLRLVRLVAHAAGIGELRSSTPPRRTRTIPTSIRRNRRTTSSARNGSWPASRLQLTGAIFWTENTNVIFIVDGTAVPPIFNQDDGQRVKGVDGWPRRSDHAVVGRQHERAVPGLEGARARTRRPTGSGWR